LTGRVESLLHAIKTSNKTANKASNTTIRPAF
jgi:hypothetical protein